MILIRKIMMKELRVVTKDDFGLNLFRGHPFIRPFEKFFVKSEF